jgi:hypothetical protein
MNPETVAVTIFAIGAIFWAGAMYQQVQNLRVDLQSIVKKFDLIDENAAELEVLKERVEGYKNRLETLEAVIRRENLRSA